MAGSKDNARRKTTRPASGRKPRISPKKGNQSAGLISASIPSDYAAGREIQKRIIDHISANGFNSQSLFAVKLALEEAIINAIKHGNKQDPNKQVHIWYKVTPKEAEIIIEDEGPGFHRTEVPDPTLAENIEKCSGRGLLLMEAYMNKIEFSKKGRRVRMIKKNEEDVLPRQ